MNVALYGKPARWAMTERGRASLHRSADALMIGASAMRWTGETLTITVDEITAPLPSRLRGTVTVRPRAVSNRVFTLDKEGRHRWRPIGPTSDVVVDFERPNLRWRGTGYLDTNDGDEPLEAAFRSWTWSRFAITGGARVFYDVVLADGDARSLSLAINPSGIVEPGQRFAYQPLRNGVWGVARAAPSGDGRQPTLLATMEDAPFYTRSKIRAHIDGVDAIGVHESLSLARVTAPWVRAMLPFRMPRWTGTRR